MEYPIIPMPPDIWPVVREIYREGIANGNATFETELPDWEKWDSSHRKDCRLVAVDQLDEEKAEQLIPLAALKVLGWAALSPVSGRRVYRGVAEVSVYVATTARGRSVGRALLEALVLESEVNGIWTLQPGHFRRTRPASSCTNLADFAKSASGAASVNSATCGETFYCWSGAVDPSARAF